MKRLLLLMLISAMAGAVIAQRPVAFDKAQLNKCIRVQHALPSDAPPAFIQGYNPSVQAPSREINDYQVGTSTYDKQSNYMVSNRIYLYDDMSIGCVWTKGEIPDNFDDRGTGYNYFDGSSWLAEPATRIETEKTGWPTYAPWGPSGEMVVAHLAEGLILSKRPQRGTGDWTITPILDEPADPTWARIITSGVNHDTLHVLASSYDPYMGQDLALLYFRSPDGGDTWDIPGVILDGTGADFYFEIHNDCYAWAEPRGNTLAFVVASAWHDMFIMKSTDGGNSWEKTVVWEHPYPFFDFETTLTDTFYCVDNSASIALDNTGKVHLAFGINRVRHDEVGTTYWLYYLVDGIGYWNEDMPTFSNDLDALSPPQYEYPTTELVEDVNYVGWTQDVDGDGEITFVDNVYYYNTIGLSTMPAITIDDQGRMFIVYSSTTETYDNFDYNYKHIWARAWSEETGWTEFVHVSSSIIHLFDECIYPVMATNSDDYLHIIYQADATPGTAIDDDHIFQENRITYSKINKYEFFPWGVDEHSQRPVFAEVSMYPNPVSGTAYISVRMKQAGDLSLEIRSVTGQMLLSQDKGPVSAGEHLFRVDADQFPEGVYLYTVTSANSSITNKMIIK